MVTAHPSSLFSNAMARIVEAGSGPADINDESLSPRDATDEEIESLRHVVDKLPRKVWVSLIVSGAERFTYYTITTPWRKCTTICQGHDMIDC